ncbi:High-affnity carbon uptake protein Hat/HatR [Minicystis rosea]|nr:High-affnity carbon uptake protein Hat/HatR [Minicystis rosea]
MQARTVTLELLRHGPSNNQLLSPLTPYLALSGNYDAETVHVGFEHVQMMRRMRDLRYQGGRAHEAAALEEASNEVSRIISTIRSLTAEISSVPRGRRDVIHLRLVLSAAELSLLPFELIKSPAGFPGHGQWLSLQTAAPIALTREVRRVSATTIRWPDRPRILVVAAAPPGVAAVPLRAHLLALRWALKHWLYKGTSEELGKHVTVLPRATIAAVREACAEAAGRGEPYTHVHVLAHGVPDEAIVDGIHGYGLAFHADGDPNRMDVVSGTRLAAALRCHPSGPAGGDLAAPAVVTVASCDSANVGDVIAPGASIAHQLHEAGVPLVLASQFPLSVRGSVIMTETVYTRLLRGEDPRTLVHDLRQTLHVACPDTHDWASVVAYAALPVDLDAQVKRARSQRALMALNAAISRCDYAERSQERPNKGAITQLREAMGWLRSTQPADDEPVDALERARLHGVLANASKRVAHVYCEGPLWPILQRVGRADHEMEAPDATSLPPNALAAARALPAAGEVVAFQEAPLAASRSASVAGTSETEAQTEARRHLEDARRHYLELFRRGTGEAWPVVQYLALSEALYPIDRQASPRDREEAERRFEGLWTTAYTLADDNLRSKRGRETTWAHSALVELYVLAQRLPERHWARIEADARAHQHLDALLQSPNDMDKYSMRRQLLRYTDWWWKGQESLAALPRALGEKMIEMGIGNTHLEDG